jgi:FlaA1/EpsC-like NDP-sugar epimerase
MAQGGDVFVLDMGQPVKIRDLAARMIHLTGLTVRDAANPDGDIEIQYTGLRPAEKLYEELLIGENVSGTEHPRIMRAEEHFLPEESLKPLLAELALAISQLDRGRIRDILRDTVQEYQPTNDIDDLVWDRRRPVEAEAPRKVVPLKKPDDRGSSVA